MSNDSPIHTLMDIEREKSLRQKAAGEAQAAMPDLLSGKSSFIALKQAVDELAGSAPHDHDVIIEAFNLAVSKVVYIEPHTLVFRGQNQQGHNASVICHFSQLIARVVYRPKRGDARIVTGFSQQQP